MNQTFAEDKFKGNMKTALLSMVITYLLTLLNYILVGQVLGEEALEAFALVIPYVSVITFFSCVISSGTSVMIAMEAGKGDRKEGNHYFQQGIILSVVIGILLSILFLASGNLLLGSMGIPSELQMYVRQYFIFMSMLPVVQMLNEFFYAVVWNAGGDRFCIGSLIVQLVSDILLSILFMKVIGIGGAALGTFISLLLADLVFYLYFRYEKHEFKWGWFFQWSYVINALRYSLKDSMCYLYLAVIQFVMNWFLMNRFGSRAVLIFSILMNLENLYLTVFSAPSDSVLVLINVYVGEKNGRGILKSMHAARKAAIIEGVVGMLGLMILADWIPLLFGLTTVASVEQAAAAIRIYALLSLVFPLIMLYSMYYLAINKIMFSIGALTMQVLVMPIACSMFLSIPFKMVGVWIGFVAGSILMFLIDILSLKLRYQNKTFPHLLDRELLDRQLSYDVPISSEGVMSLVNRIEQDLTERGIERGKILRIMLMVEETEMLVVEKNQGKGGIIQCDLFFEDKIRLVLRDSGPYSNATNKDNEVESFRAYAASMIVGSMNSNRYVVVWGNNRTLCEF